MAGEDKVVVVSVLYFIENWRIDRSEAGPNVPHREYFWRGTRFARFFRNLTQRHKAAEQHKESLQTKKMRRTFVAIIGASLVSLCEIAKDEEAGNYLMTVVVLRHLRIGAMIFQFQKRLMASEFLRRNASKGQSFMKGDERCSHMMEAI